MKKLAKSKDNAVIFGVLGGLGEYFNIDPVLLRVLVVVATFVGVGSTVPVYLLLALVMPDDQSSSQDKTEKSYKSSSFGQSSNKPKRKEAEKIEDDDWSDF